MHKILPILALVLAVALMAPASEDSTDHPGVVNVNTASAQQLQLLPRIGPSLSQRIIDFREANGPFESAGELVAVKGIGERSLESLKPYIAVEGETTLSTKVRLPRSTRDESAD